MRLLQGALGGAAIPPPAFDFTGKGKYPDVFANFDTFTTLSSTFEDLGVAAYKGQAGNLQGTPVLTTALQIHSVEARHAAEVRRVRGFVGWDGSLRRAADQGCGVGRGRTVPGRRCLKAPHVGGEDRDGAMPRTRFGGSAVLAAPLMPTRR